MHHLRTIIPVRRLLALALLLAVASVSAHAQERGTWWGPIITYSPDFIFSTSSDATVYTGTADCGVFSSGRTRSWWGGGVIERPNLISSAGGRLRVMWGEVSTMFETAAVDPIVLLGDSGTMLQAEHGYLLDVHEHRLRIEPAITIPMAPTITLALGLPLDFSTSFSATQYDRLDAGGDILFDSGRTQKPMAAAESYGANTINVGLAGGGSWFLPLGRSTQLELSLDIVVGLSGPLANHNGLTPSARLAAALLFNPAGNDNPPDTAQPPLLAADTAGRDTIRRDSARTTPTVDRSLNVAIDMHGEDDAGAPSSEAIVMLNEMVERVINRNGDTIEHTSRTVVPPRLRLQPAIHAGTGVRRWHIDLLYEGRVVGRYADTGTVNNDEVRWRITEQEAARTASTLTALLVVEDSLGSSATAQATLPIRFVRHGRVLLRDSLRSTLVATLYPPEADAPDELAERDLDALDDLTLHLPAGARVDVLLSNTEDRTTGMRRARAVAEELRHLLRLRRAPTVQVATIDDRLLGGAPPEGIRVSRSIAVRAALPDRGER